MNEIIQIVQLLLTLLIVPVLGYVVRLERRITKIETIIEIILKNYFSKGGEKE